VDIEIERSKLPKHIAIILDGNGRWATQHNLPRSQGHIEGVRRVEEIVDEANRLGIQALTLYTFSTENWERPKKEVSFIMNTLNVVLHRKLKKLKDDNIRFMTIGRREYLPEPILKAIDEVTRETKDNTGLIVNLAFNYGARLEIVDAIKDICRAVQGNKLTIDQINEDVVSRNLYTRNLPDPDLLIRTSGENRISNFLLWQLSYAEFYFTPKFWPEFTVDEFQAALIDFQQRERRFGKLNPSD